MRIKQKIRTLVSPLYNLVSPLYNKVWYTPKGRLAQKVRAGCDAIPQRKRLGLVAVLFGALLLTAFLLFGNACYRMGQGKARQQIQVEHIQQLEIPTKNSAAYEMD